METEGVGRKKKKKLKSTKNKGQVKSSLHGKSNLYPDTAPGAAQGAKGDLNISQHVAGKNAPSEKGEEKRTQVREKTTRRCISNASAAATISLQNHRW